MKYKSCLFSPYAKKYYEAYYNRSVEKIPVTKKVLLLDHFDRKGFRSSYRSIIRRAEEKFQYKFNKYKDFYDLRNKFVGKTRPDKSFAAEQKISEKEQGFLITIYDGFLCIGGYSFFGYENNFYYASGITHPEFVRENVNHLGIALAISWINGQGKSVLNFGDVYEGEDQKLKNIYFFKKGFAGKEIEVDTFEWKVC